MSSLKVDLLTKLLGLTSSSNDNEALTAIRKANTLLRDSGWTWESLLSGKITIVADPFTGLTPPAARAAQPEPPRTPSYPKPANNPNYNYASPPPYTPPPPPTYGNNYPNRYADFCYFCGTSVAITAGFTFRLPKRTSSSVACHSCDTNYRGTPLNSLPTRKAIPKRDIDSFFNSL